MYALFSSHKGFSLVEALVAVGILALGLVAVIGVFPLTLRVNKEAEQMSLASVYARAKLEQVSQLSYDDLAVGDYEVRARISADSSDPAYHLERQTVVSYVDSSLQNSVSDTGFKKVQVTVYWSDRNGGNDSYVLTTLMARK